MTEPEKIQDTLKKNIPSWVTNPESRWEEVQPPGPEARATHLGVPKLYFAAKVSDFDSKDFSGKQAPDVESPRHLLITGKNGAGKSHLACALALKWGAYRVRASRICTRARSVFGKSSGTTESEVIADYTDPPILVIDDLTAVNATPHAVGTLLDILDTRVEAVKPTIVTCYQGSKEVMKLDPSIADRLRGFERVHLVGESRRGKGRRNER